MHPQGVSLEERAAKHSSVIKVLDDEEIEGLKVACKLGREVLDEAAKAVAIGVTADEIDRIVHEVSLFIFLFDFSLALGRKFQRVCTFSRRWVF